MNITELIEALKLLHAEHGDLPVCTDDYTGGDYELREATPVLNDRHGYGKIIIVEGHGRL